MIDGLTEYARENWPFWFGHFPDSVGIAIGSGGPAHRTRQPEPVFEADGGGPPVMKIALTDLEAGFLRHEHDALTEIRPLLPGPMRSTVLSGVGFGRDRGEHGPHNGGAGGATSPRPRSQRAGGHCPDR